MIWARPSSGTCGSCRAQIIIQLAVDFPGARCWIIAAGAFCGCLSHTEEINGELMMVWARQDPHVPDEGRARIRACLLETKRNFTWHEFNAAHAFLRDEGPRYDPALALLSSYRLDESTCSSAPR